MRKKLKVLFMGTPGCAVPFLEYLALNHNVVGVCTAPDRPKGRHLHPMQSEVKKYTIGHAFPLFQPITMHDKAVISAINNYTPDVIIVVAFGYKLPSEILSIPKYGCINIHFSLLPKYRGAAPISWAIAHGETETGVTSFFITNVMDGGDIIFQEKTAVFDNDTTETLTPRLVELGVRTLDKSLKLIMDNSFAPMSQDNRYASLAPKLKKNNGCINWNLPNYTIRNHMRAFHPWPGTYSYLKQGQEKVLVKLLDAKLCDDESNFLPGTIIAINEQCGMRIACGEGSLWIRRVQCAGGRMMNPHEACIGRKIKVGDVFEV